MMLCLEKLCIIFAQHHEVNSLQEALPLSSMDKRMFKAVGCRGRANSALMQLPAWAEERGFDRVDHPLTAMVGL